MSKITCLKILITWDDGTEQEIGSYLPAGLSNDLENFLDYWEERYGEDQESQDA